VLLIRRTPRDANSTQNSICPSPGGSSLAWVLDGWEGKQWAIALDATSLGDRFVVLAVSVLYRGCAVPVAWKVLKAQRKHAWKPENG